MNLLLKNAISFCDYSTYFVSHTCIHARYAAAFMSSCNACHIVFPLQVRPSSVTVLGIFGNAEEVNRITGHLSLL